MASSLEELIEEWELKMAMAETLLWHNAIKMCLKDLRDTMLVMEAEEVRKEIK